MEYGPSKDIKAILCYLIPLICPLIFIFGDDWKGDRFLRFHAVQSLILTIAFAAVNIILSIIRAIMSFAFLFPIAILLNVIAGLLGFCFIAVSVVCIVRAYNGERFMLPVIGIMAERYAAR